MDIRIDQKAGVSVAVLSGEFRSEDQSSLNAALAAEPAAKIVVDLAGLSYINSGGLGSLVQLTAKTNTQGGTVILAAPSPFVSGVLEATRLDRFFEISDDVDTAVARLADRPAVPGSSAR